MNDGIVIDEPNPLFAHREERREHLSTALQFFDFLTDSEELGTIQHNERTQSLTTSIRRRIEQLAREIREELGKDETTSSALSESDRLCQEEQSEKDRRILSRADAVLLLANEIDH